jgi:hypothetical protein
MYLWPARKRPKSLRVDRVWVSMEFQKTEPARREFSRRMEALPSNDDEEFRKLLRRGWRFRAHDFLDRLEKRLTGPLSDNHDPGQVAEMTQVRATRLA